MSKNKKDGRSSNGGARPGSGAKRKLEGGAGKMVYLDEKTVNTLTALGDGNLSAGIRKAAEVLSGSNTKIIFRYRKEEAS